MIELPQLWIPRRNLWPDKSHRWPREFGPSARFIQKMGTAIDCCWSSPAWSDSCQVFYMPYPFHPAEVDVAFSGIQNDACACEHMDDAYEGLEHTRSTATGNVCREYYSLQVGDIIASAVFSANYVTEKIQLLAGVGDAGVFCSGCLDGPYLQFYDSGVWEGWTGSSGPWPSSGSQECYPTTTCGSGCDTTAGTAVVTW